MVTFKAIPATESTADQQRRIPRNFADIFIERIELAVADGKLQLTLEQWGKLYARLFPEEFAEPGEPGADPRHAELARAIAEFTASKRLALTGRVA